MQSTLDFLFLSHFILVLLFTPTSFISSVLSVTKCFLFSHPLLYLEFCRFLMSVVTLLIQGMIISFLDYCSSVTDDFCLVLPYYTFHIAILKLPSDYFILFYLKFSSGSSLSLELNPSSLEDHA